MLFTHSITIIADTSADTRQYHRTTVQLSSRSAATVRPHRTKLIISASQCICSVAVKQLIAAEIYE